MSNATDTSGAKTAKAGADLSRIQKLAALLLIISEENAVQIMRAFNEQELETVAAEMAKLPSISQELQEEILEEFTPTAIEAASSIAAGVGRVESLLEKSVGLFRSSDILCRVSASRTPVGAMKQIVEMDPRHIFNLLRNEQLQTVALVASFLSREKAAQVLALFRPDAREQVIERLAMLAPTSTEVVESVAEELQRKFGGNRQRAMSQTGGVRVAAQVLNALPKDMSKATLASLQERNSELAKAVGKRMFTFEELERLEPRTLQVLLQKVDVQTLTVALKTAGESLKSAILGSISKRAAEAVKEEMGLMGPIKLSEVEAAQSAIIDVVKQLESDGEIDLDSSRSRAA